MSVNLVQDGNFKTLPPLQQVPVMDEFRGVSHISHPHQSGVRTIDQRHISPNHQSTERDTQHATQKHTDNGRCSVCVRKGLRKQNEFKKVCVCVFACNCVYIRDTPIPPFHCRYLNYTVSIGRYRVPMQSITSAEQ